jgi:hypothetical protein
MPTPEPLCLVYAEEVSPRLTYITDVIWNKQASVTNDMVRFQNFRGDRLQYTRKKIFPEILHIQAQELLFQESIIPLQITATEWETMPVFFTGNGDIPFDWLAASFYLISRYEEYLPFQPDRYGRFPVQASLAHRLEFLHKPLVQVWTALLRRKFRLFSLPAMQEAPEIQLTFDMDELFQFRHHPLGRQLKRMAGNFLRLDFEQVVMQLKVLSGNAPDPYDLWQGSWNGLETMSKKPIFFFPATGKVGGMDRQLPVDHYAVNEILQRCDRKGLVGWHPSWASSNHPQLLRKELESLQSAAKQKISKSRFHYLRFQLPQDYHRLLELGIEHEFSMGYGNTFGFRASFADAFPWFDLSKNQPTSLVVHPFFYMDAIPVFQEKTVPAAALNYINNIREQGKGVVQELSLVFHPHALAKTSWRELLAFVSNGSDIKLHQRR